MPFLGECDNNTIYLSQILHICNSNFESLFPIRVLPSQCTRTQNATSVFGDIESVRGGDFLQLRCREILNPSKYIYTSGVLDIYFASTSTLKYNLQFASISRISAIRLAGVSNSSFRSVIHGVRATQNQVNCLYISVSRLVNLSPVFATRFQTKFVSVCMMSMVFVWILTREYVYVCT